MLIAQLDLRLTKRRHEAKLRRDGARQLIGAQPQLPFYDDNKLFIVRIGLHILDPIIAIRQSQSFDLQISDKWPISDGTAPSS
jgi:hypothetical protein